MTAESTPFPDAAETAPAAAAADAKEKGAPDFQVTLTATGGELGKAVETIVIRVKGGKAVTTSTHVSANGEKAARSVDLPADALARLHKVIEQTKAWDLKDFKRTVLDAPTYTIRLEQGKKKHTVRATGASQSDRHLKLILAIENCYREGGKK